MPSTPAAISRSRVCANSTADGVGWTHFDMSTAARGATSPFTTQIPRRTTSAVRAERAHADTASPIPTNAAK